MAAHARDVNILIWTSRRSVDHETNDRVMVHGDGTRADSRRFKIYVHTSKILGPRDRRAAGAFGNRKSNVGHAQAGYLARPTTKAPETQIYFINYRSGAFPVPRVRTVVRGERASRSIVNRITALWSIWMVASLILAGPGIKARLHVNAGRGFVVSRGSNGSSNIPRPVSIRPKWTLPLTNGRKRT